MKAKNIYNIVFYNFFEGDREIKKACIFFRDGTVKDTTFDEGLDACELIVKERGITSKNTFQEMINKDIVHVMSAEDFTKNYTKFESHLPIDREMIEDAIDEKITTTKVSEAEEDENLRAVVVNPNGEYRGKHVKKESVAETTPVSETTEEDEDDDVLDVEEENGLEVSGDEVTPVVTSEKAKEEGSHTPVYVIDQNGNVIDENGKVVSTTKQEEKKEGFFKRHWKKLVAATLAILIGLGLYSCNKRQTLEGQMFRSNLTTAEDHLLDEEEAKSPYTVGDQEATITIDPTVVTTPEAVATPAGTNTVEQFYDETTGTTLVRGNNDYYDGYTYEQLLAVTQNATQKRAMTNVHSAIYGFNGPFAAAYVEEGKDVRPALSFDEVLTLQQAYNDFSRDQIRAIFNGEDVDATKLSQNYKSATLQLMGAHILENSEHPVDMSMLLETEEGKAFYQRYHEMFLRAKETTGEEQLAAVKAFYDAVRADFPITQQERTEGIAHRDAYASLESYKISVIPMIAASEMLFQNLDVDYTLNDMEIDWINDVGICNLIDSKAKRIETIMLSACVEDNTNPLLDQYREAMEKNLRDLHIYGIDDAHRELTQLDRFYAELDRQNPHITTGDQGYWSYEGTTTTTTTTRQETETWTETHTETHTETEEIEAPIPDEERDKIDQEIERENEERRRRAEEEAKREEERLQREADEAARRVEEEIEQDHQDMQDRIDDANDQIDQNQDSDPSNDRPVNEEDFGDHNVDFYDEHEDGNGNLNDSVENITTDGTGAVQPGDPLPDPNETGAEFDRQAEDYNIPTEIVIESNSSSSSRSAEPQAKSASTKDATESKPAQEEHHEEPKAEEHYEAPKAEEHHEEPKVEEHHEAPKTEEHHEEPKHEEPVYTPVEVPTEIVVDENTSIEIPAPKGGSSNEDLVDSYLDSLENATDEDAIEYSLH